MQELEVPSSTTGPWFPQLSAGAFTRIEVPAAVAEEWTRVLGVPVRRCYISDEVLAARVLATSRPSSEIVAAVMPPRGSTMAGDFGEILVALYQAGTLAPRDVLEPKKWRLKQDRAKPAPYSDVVQFVTPEWPTPTADDWILCAEVKTKSTSGSSQPIPKAIEDSTKDRLSRLAKTLAWLQARALKDGFASVSIAHLDRFMNLAEYPPPHKQFSAIAVISSELVDAELLTVPDEIPVECGLVVLSVPDLRNVYQLVFDAVDASVRENGIVE